MNLQTTNYRICLGTTDEVLVGIKVLNVLTLHIAFEHKLTRHS